MESFLHNDSFSLSLVSSGGLSLAPCQSEVEPRNVEELMSYELVLMSIYSAFLQNDNSEACSILFFRGFLVRLSFSCLQRSSTHCHTFIGFSPFSDSLSFLPHLSFLGHCPGIIAQANYLHPRSVLGPEPRLRQEPRPLN